MAADPVQREELHRLVDQLPAASLAPVVRLLRRAQDPLLAALDAAPPDDEAVNADDEAAIDEAWQDVHAGRLRALDEALRDLDENAD